MIIILVLLLHGFQCIPPATLQIKMDFDSSVETVKGPPVASTGESQSGRDAVPGLPAREGVYYKSSEGFEGLEPVTSEQKAKRSLSGMEFEEIYQGEKARTRVSSNSKGLYVRFDRSAQAQGQEVLLFNNTPVFMNNVRVLRLDENRGDRKATYRIKLTSTMPENEYKDKYVVSITVRKISDNILYVEFDSELKSGEYVLSLHTLKYDFGVDKK